MSRSDHLSNTYLAIVDQAIMLVSVNVMAVWFAATIRFTSSSHIVTYFIINLISVKIPFLYY